MKDKEAEDVVRKLCVLSQMFKSDNFTAACAILTYAKLLRLRHPEWDWTLLDNETLSIAVQYNNKGLLDEQGSKGGE